MISINIIEKLNLYDGEYYIDMGPGWIIGNDESSILGTLIIPSGCTATFNEQIKFESTIKVMASGSAEFDVKKFSLSFSVAVGHEWIKELTYSHAISYTAYDNKYKYVQIYLIRHRHDILKISNGQIQDWASGYGGEINSSGIWGEYLDFEPYKLVDISALEQPITKSFITDGNPQIVSLYKSSLKIISTMQIMYSPGVTITKSFNINDDNSDVTVKIISNTERAYDFMIKNGECCQNVVVYKESSSDMINYIASIDDNSIESKLVIDMEEDTAYYFRFINCNKGSLSLIYKDFNNKELYDYNTSIDLYDKVIYYINDISLKETITLKLPHLYIGKIIYYAITTTTRYNRLNFNIKNDKFNLKIYQSDNKTDNYILNSGTNNINLFAGFEFFMSIECKDILDINNLIEFHLE